MPNIALSTPLTLNGGTVKIGANTYSGISNFTLSASQSTSQIKGLSAGEVYSFSTAPVYALGIKFGQDIKLSTSLLNYLLANVGQTVSVVFTGNGTNGLPGTTGAPIITVSAIVPAPNIGGDMDTVLDETVTFACNGLPVITYVP